MYKTIAISKYASDAEVLKAYKEGQRDFGENYVLAALARIDRLAALMPEARWHLVGHLQTNKVNKAVANFALIQSVDSMKIAELIAKRAVVLGIEQAVLLQINISAEESKSGFSKEEILKEFPKLIKLKGIKIEGLMTIAPQLDVETEQQQITEVFKSLADLKRVLETNYKYQLKELSMGMSNDYLLAIQQGSTMIRIGRSFFENGSGQKQESVVK